MITRRCGERDDIRGLWFHDKEFMSPFTRALEAICREIGVRCDGIYEHATITEDLPSNTSGAAILRMLKKSEPQEESTSSVVSRVPERQNPGQSIVDLLRKEFEAVDSTPIAQLPGSYEDGRNPGIGNFAGIDIRNKQMSGQRGPSWGSPMISENSEELMTFTRESLRAAIQSVVSSDSFVDSVLAQLKATTHR